MVKVQWSNIDFFLAQVRKYMEFKEPDTEIICASAERIDVFMPKKASYTRAKSRQSLSTGTSSA